MQCMRYRKCTGTPAADEQLMSVETRLSSFRTLQELVEAEAVLRSHDHYYPRRIVSFFYLQENIQNQSLGTQTTVIYNSSYCAFFVLYLIHCKIREHAFFSGMSLLLVRPRLRSACHT